MISEIKVELPKGHPFTDFIESLPPNSILRPDHIEYGTGQRYMFSFSEPHCCSRLRNLIDHVQDSKEYCVSVISCHHLEGSSMGIFMFHLPYEARITRPPAEVLAEEMTREEEERIISKIREPEISTPSEMPGIQIQETY